MNNSVIIKSKVYLFVISSVFFFFDLSYFFIHWVFGPPNTTISNHVIWVQSNLSVIKFIWYSLCMHLTNVYTHVLWVRILCNTRYFKLLKMFYMYSCFLLRFVYYFVLHTFCKNWEFWTRPAIAPIMVSPYVKG